MGPLSVTLPAITSQTAIQDLDSGMTCRDRGRFLCPKMLLSGMAGVAFLIPHVANLTGLVYKSTT